MNDAVSHEQVEEEVKQEKKKDGRSGPRSKEQMESLAKARIALNESRK